MQPYNLWEGFSLTGSFEKQRTSPQDEVFRAQGLGLQGRGPKRLRINFGFGEFKARGLVV